MIVNALAAATMLFAGLQDTPVEIPKQELPKTAVCLVCSGNGEEHGEEKPAGGVRYKGKEYYFCNSAEILAFKKDPEAYLPPVLPRPAPKLSATTLDGKTISLEDYKGKVVLLDFWATWCEPCVKAMPHLDKLQKQYGEKSFTVLGVSIDEDTKKVGPFAEKKKLSYPLVLDSAEAPTWHAYRVTAIPALFLIDRNGQIIAQWRGSPKDEEIAAAVKAAVEAP